jgi:bacterioferritin-associated ferredoxin
MGQTTEGAAVIVCHCRVVNDRDLAAAVDAGARSVAQVCRATGAGSDCGSCVFTVKRLLCQHEVATQAIFMEVEGEAS